MASPNIFEEGDCTLYDVRSAVMWADPTPDELFGDVYVYYAGSPMQNWVVHTPSERWRIKKAESLGVIPGGVTPAVIENWFRENNDGNNVLFWRLSQDATDRLTNTYNGLPFEVSFQTPGLSTGGIQSAFFDGNSEGISVPVAGPTGLDDFTTKSFGFLFKPTGSLGSRKFMLDLGGTTNGLNVYWNANDLYVGAYSNENGAQEEIFLNLGTILVNQTYNVQVTFDNGTLTAYLDGVATSASFPTNTILGGASNGYGLGARLDDGRYDGGTLGGTSDSFSDVMVGHIESFFMTTNVLNPTQLAEIRQISIDGGELTTNLEDSVHVFRDGLSFYDVRYAVTWTYNTDGTVTVYYVDSQQKTSITHVDTTEWANVKQASLAAGG